MSRQMTGHSLIQQNSPNFVSQFLMNPFWSDISINVFFKEVVQKDALFIMIYRFLLHLQQKIYDLWQIAADGKVLIKSIPYLIQEYL